MTPRSVNYSVQLFGVIESVDHQADGQNAGGGNHGAAKRAATCFVTACLDASFLQEAQQMGDFFRIVCLCTLHECKSTQFI